MLLQIPSPDVLVVPGGFGTGGLVHDKPIVDWIRKVCDHSTFREGNFTK